MKKLMTISVAITLIFMSVNAYACGNKSKADAATAKSEMTDASNSCASDAKVATTAAKTGDEARVITTDFKDCSYMKGAMEKASAKVEKAESGCCPASNTTKASMKSKAKTDSKAGSVEVTREDDSGKMALISDPSAAAPSAK